jgi:serine protease Do
MMHQIYPWIRWVRLAALPLLFQGPVACDSTSGIAADAPLLAAPATAAPRWGPAPRDLAAYTQELAEVQAQMGAERGTAIVRASERVGPSVVSIHVLRTQQVRVRDPFEDFFGGWGGLWGGGRTESARVPGLGSGFVLDPSGLILTNDHVVRGAERILITFPDGRDAEAELVGSDEATDVALLRIDLDDVPPAPLGESRDLRIGEWVIAFGNPFGNLISNPEPTVTVGVVSALGRHILPGREERGFSLGMIQTDAAINPGNSGGPLVNALGEVVGMNASIFSRGGGSEGLGFAIPIERVLRIAQDLLRHGEVRRAWIGLEVEGAEADVFGRSRGVRVARVAQESPAGRAGIRASDRLVQLNGRRLTTPLDFEAVLLDLRAGDPVQVDIEGRREPVALVAEESPVLRAERLTILRGIQVTTLTSTLRDAQGIQSEAGVMVTRVSPSEGNILQLREGDVIVGVGQRRVDSAEALAAILEQAPPGARVTLWVERNQSIFRRDFALGR